MVMSLLVGSAFAWDGIGSTWPEMPVQYYVATDLDGFDEPATLDAVQAAFQTYDDIECARIRFEYLGRTADTFATSDGQNTVSLVGAGWPLDPARVSSEVLTIGSAAIYEADIGLNTQDHTWVFADADGVETLDIQAGLTHEVGRLLGLGDSRDPDATQNPLLAGDPEGRTLADDDIEALCTLYPTDEAVGAVPLGGSCDDTSDCKEPYRCVSDAGEQYCAPSCPGGLCPADYLCFDPLKGGTPTCTKAGCGCATGSSPASAVALVFVAAFAVRARGAAGRVRGQGSAARPSTAGAPSTTTPRRR